MSKFFQLHLKEKNNGGMKGTKITEQNYEEKGRKYDEVNYHF